MGTSPRYINVQIAALLALVCTAASGAVAQTAVPAPSDFRVTLLGTSTPNPLPDRFGPSTLVEAGNERLLFDCGRGATIRLWQLRIPLGTVKLFITCAFLEIAGQAVLQRLTSFWAGISSRTGVPEKNVDS